MDDLRIDGGAMNRTAYVVGYIDKRSRAFLGWGVFSEPNPTAALKHYTFVALAVEGATYAEAHDEAVRRAQTDAWLSWAEVKER